MTDIKSKLGRHSVDYPRRRSTRSLIGCTVRSLTSKLSSPRQPAPVRLLPGQIDTLGF